MLFGRSARLLTSLKSAPICSPNPTPPVAMHEGADQVPPSRRAMTTPLPAFPDQTKPALSTVKMANLLLSTSDQYERLGGPAERRNAYPLALASTSFGILLSALSG